MYYVNLTLIYLFSGGQLIVNGTLVRWVQYLATTGGFPASADALR